MYRGRNALVAAIFLGFSAVAAGQRVSTRATDLPIGTQSWGNLGRECARNPGTRNDAQQSADRGQRSYDMQPEAVDPPTISTPPMVDLKEDLKMLAQGQAELANCVAAATDEGIPDGPAGACFGQLALNFEVRRDGELVRAVPIGRLPGSTAFFYESGMTIDADGAPNAYHPQNLGLDDLANAGSPGNWEGLAKDANGDPFVQGPDDPFPGYYVSATALTDRTKPVYDPAHYVDASKIPFVVLPGWMARQLGARPGDFAVVFNNGNGQSSYAIFGDVGPPDQIGEGSIALAENLGIRSDARRGGARGGIVYLVFPGSGNGRPRTVEEIDAEGEKLLQAWEASIQLTACADDPLEHSGRASQNGN